MKLQTLLKLMRFWPPFLGAGIRVKQLNEALTCVEVQMKMRFWNKNYVGTHFGGSLYAMTDPFYMLMLLHNLGKGYIVWDKSASIRYKKPAKGTVSAVFTLPEEEIELIKKSLETNEKIEREYSISICNDQAEVVAEVKKLIYIRARPLKN